MHWGYTGSLCTGATLDPYPLGLHWLPIHWGYTRSLCTGATLDPYPMGLHWLPIHWGYTRSLCTGATLDPYPMGLHWLPIHWGYTRSMCTGATGFLCTGATAIHHEAQDSLFQLLSVYRCVPKVCCCFSKFSITVCESDPQRSTAKPRTVSVNCCGQRHR